ncbi:acetyl-CoA C-acyltransferase [Noviherbaspirillum denitrificans]|uniref:Acetyl-CoA acetyltransferase n=1 Tax=Noviherbaspirillum denitrificans TaxID=1968433 RepID=A0A254TJ79_9BURK|nr:acetyl-CoA C-acyltransferase [Noviherbaspirillum denitrificans]OWW20643.1 acetyl-CoA acetyltransferase [Noviherbaspirillum denitrificans]
MTDKVVICGSARTPIGGFMGELSGVTASDLGAVAIRAAVECARVPMQDVGELIMGNCLFAGQGQAPARQAGRKAGLPDAAGATTLSKMCGSGMKSIMLGRDMLLAGSQDVVVAGGMESMSNAPYIVPKARRGHRLGHGTLVDHMLLDGLEDAYESGKLMGHFAEDCARHFQFTREEQDAYALLSLSRARDAQGSGYFYAEITPVSVGEREITSDEQPRRADSAKIPSLKPAFSKDGTVTAANSSSISDGAAAVVLARESYALEHGLAVEARIVGHSTFAQEPAWFSTAPIGAIRTLCARIGWAVGDVDLFEINEAFAVVVMAAMKELGLPREKVNVFGGACALGHPIGASGARVVVTLLNALKQKGKKRGIACLCIGGGEATAVAVEMIG